MGAAVGWLEQILFYSILIYPILFYSILFYSILFYSILFYSILFYSILFYSMGFSCRTLATYCVIFSDAERERERDPPCP